MFHRLRTTGAQKSMCLTTLIWPDVLWRILLLVCYILLKHDVFSIGEVELLMLNWLCLYFVSSIAYLACLEDSRCTELLLHEYKAATNMTDQFAALAAIAQNPGKTHDDVLADFYSKWQDDYLVKLLPQSIVPKLLEWALFVCSTKNLSANTTQNCFVVQCFCLLLLFSMFVIFNLLSNCLIYANKASPFLLF